MNQIFDSIDERYSIRHLTGQVRSVIVQRTFYTLHIRYMFVFSVIHPLFIRQSTLVDRSLSVKYALLIRFMRSLHVSRRLHRHRDNFHHWRPPDNHFFFAFFCPFGVRYPYPVICDSTIKGPRTVLMKDCP